VMLSTKILRVNTAIHINSNEKAELNHQ